MSEGVDDEKYWRELVDPESKTWLQIAKQPRSGVARRFKGGSLLLCAIVDGSNGVSGELRTHGSVYWRLFSRLRQTRIKVGAGFRDRRLEFTGEREPNVVEGAVSAMELEVAEPHPEMAAMDERSRAYRVVSSGPDELMTNVLPDAWKPIRLQFLVRATEATAETVNGQGGEDGTSRLAPNDMPESAVHGGGGVVAETEGLTNGLVKAFGQLPILSNSSIRVSVQVNNGSVVLARGGVETVLRVVDVVNCVDKAALSGLLANAENLRNQAWGMYQGLPNLAHEERVRVEQRISTLCQEVANVFDQVAALMSGSSSARHS